MKLFKVNGRRIAAKTISDAVEAYKAKRIDLDDASASGTAELTDIINDLLQKKKPLDINERVDVNGKRVKGQIHIFYNGGMIELGFTPKSGDFAMLGKSSSVGVPVDSKTKTVKRSDVNKAAQAIFEFADKQTETQKSLANEKPKLLGYKLEFIEGEQSAIRKRMMNKLVDFDDMVRFLQGEEDRRQSTGEKGYDKAYIDAVYSIGGKHYRVHGARFDVGDGGDVRSRLKAETGYLDKEIEAFRKSGYSRSVKEGDCKDASGVDFDYLLAEERKAVEDYREAIAQTTDAKLLTVLSHILKEETEHIEELEAARNGIYEDKGLMDAEVLTRQELRNTAPKDSVRDAKYKPATLRSYVRTPKNGGGARVTIESMEEAKRKGWEDLNEDVDFLGDIYHLFFDENGDMGDKFKLVLKKNNTPDGYLRFIPAPKQVRNNLLKVFTSIPDGWEEGRDRRIIPYAPIGFSIIQKIGDPSEIALLKRW